MPIISIIVPVYNSELYLKNCIESLINQTIKDIEIILIDDGSTDDSCNICKMYSEYDSRIKLISKKNEGVSICRNIGISNALGQYIMFCDSDDRVDKKWCEELLNSISNGYDISVCGFKWIDNDKIVNKVFCNNKETVYISKQDIFKLREKDIFNVLWNKIFKANIIKDNNILFDTNLSLGEDVIFILDYLKNMNKNIGIVNETLYYYSFKRENNLAGKYRKDLFEIYRKIFRELYNTSCKLNIDLDIYKYEYYNSYFSALLRCLDNTFSKYNNEKFFEKVSRNNKILQCNDFKQCAQNINKLDYDKRYINCLLTGNYIYVYIFRKLFNLKLKIKKYLKN